MIAALFDCDGTLFSAQFGRGLMKYAADHGYTWRVRRYFATVFLPFYLSKINLFNPDRAYRLILKELARIMQGFDLALADDCFDYIAYQYSVPTCYPEVIDRLRWHQQQGHHVLFVSAQYMPGVERLGGHFGADGVIGTQVEIKDGRYTGKVILPVLTSEDKARYAQEYFSAQGISVDWENSFAYADSIHDREMLNMVGNPVMVYPEPELAAVGQNNGWAMIGEIKEK